VSAIRVALPSHLRTLAGVGGEVVVQAGEAPTIDEVLDRLEAAHPALAGTVRDRQTRRRRPYMRYMACGRDLSHEPADAPVPDEVARGDEPLRLVGAISGG
jgi:hypothetical protein